MNDCGNGNSLPASSGRPGAAPRAGEKYLVTVGTLLVIIIAFLAVLWLRERAARVAADGRLAAMQQRLGQLEGAVGDLVVRASGTQFEPIRREDLPAWQVNLDGRERTVLQIGVSAGRRLGFRPGDLITVAEHRPGTQPRPATAGAPSGSQQPP